MSRSRRKHPFCSITCSGFRRGEKRDKQIANGRMRVAERAWLAGERERPDPVIREVVNVYCFSKDGKHRFDPQRYPELSRK